MKTLIYILTLFISIPVFAQSQLGMHANHVIKPSAATSATIGGVPYSSTISVTCYVQNKGNAIFNGSFTVLRAVRSGSLQTAAVAVASVTTSLNPNDTTHVTFIDSITPTAYKSNGNGNTIVVWPVSSTALTADSLSTMKVYVNNPTGIQELDKQKLLIYPNPVGQELFIKPEPSADYKEIIIYDLQMKALMQQPYTESVDIRGLPSGSYIITVSDGKGTRYSSRFTKTD